MSGLPLVGTGVDVHAFEEGRELWVAGLHWPGEIGLAGHSDADVVAHAACNALFSAAGLGDLGAQFGTSDPEWSGASGAMLLAEAARRVRAAGFEIGNVSVQVVGVRPRIGPRRAEAEAVLSEAAGAPVRVAAEKDWQRSPRHWWLPNPEGSGPRLYPFGAKLIHRRGTARKPRVLGMET